jgi:hypothetical protein
VAELVGPACSPRPGPAFAVSAGRARASGFGGASTAQGLTTAPMGKIDGVVLDDGTVVHKNSARGPSRSPEGNRRPRMVIKINVRSHDTPNLAGCPDRRELSRAPVRRIRNSDAAGGRSPDIGRYREVLPDPRSPGRLARAGPVERNVVGQRHACSKKPPRSRGGVVTSTVVPPVDIDSSKPKVLTIYSHVSSSRMNRNDDEIRAGVIGRSRQEGCRRRRP